MSEIARIAVDGYSMTLHTDRGRVAGASKWSTTEVSGGGGSGYVHQGTGYSSTAPVRSRTTEHDQFFVRTTAGKEIPVRLSDVQLALRDDHDVSVFWGVGEGRQAGPYLAIHNHTTDETTWITKSGGKELFGSGPTARFIAFGIGLVVGVIALLASLGSMSLVGIAVSGAIAWFCWSSLQKMIRTMKKLELEIKNAANQALGRVAHA